MSAKFNVKNACIGPDSETLTRNTREPVEKNNRLIVSEVVIQTSCLFSLIKLIIYKSFKSHSSYHQ